MIKDYQKKRTRSDRSVRGSVFVMIFLGIALFGALSFTLIRSMRSGGASIDKDNGKLVASDALAYLDQIRTAVKALKVAGCTDTQITFEGSGYQGGASGPYAGNAIMLPAGANPNAPTDKSCNVFDRSGGGVIARTLDDTAANPAPGSWAKGGTIWFQMQNLPGIGTSSGVDIIAIVPYVSESVCTAYNVLNGVGGPSGDRVAIPWAAGGAPYNFAGTYTATMTGGATGTYVSGTRAFCFCDDPASCNNFPTSRQLAMVVLAR